MKNLLEAYKQKLSVADSYYAKLHEGERMDNSKRLCLARVLENTQNFLNEAFAPTGSGIGTGLAGQQLNGNNSLGAWKRFCMNLNTVVLPNLIVQDLMIVQPMSSMTGVVAYMNYVAGTTKGGVTRGDHFNGVFSLGDMTKDRMNYTGQAVVESFKVPADYTSGTVTVTASWFPVLEAKNRPDLAPVVITNPTVEGGTVVLGDDLKTMTITFTTAPSAGDEFKVRYVYDNAYIPANDLPTIQARMDTVNLTAHARRIAVQYSNLAAFQARTDYGFDMGAELASQAVAELQYEIDSEGVQMLADAAEENSTLVWSKTLPVGVDYNLFLVA